MLMHSLVELSTTYKQKAFGSFLMVVTMGCRLYTLPVLLISGVCVNHLQTLRKGCIHSYFTKLTEKIAVQALCF